MDSLSDMEENNPRSKKKKGASSDGEDGGHKKNWREYTATLAEIKATLSDHAYLRYNLVKHRVEYRLPASDPFVQNSELAEFVSPEWQPMGDRLKNTLLDVLCAVKYTRKSDLETVLESGFVPGFHPFRHYFSRLPPWDGQNHILALSSTVMVRGGVDMQMRFYEYLRKWLVAMVASWLDDEEVNQTVLVLIGDQGSYKTTWFAKLLPPELRGYFRIKVNASSLRADDFIALSQFGLVCLEELAPMKPTQVETMKSMVTAPAIDERKPYGRYPEHMPHVASFCGTGNNMQFLNDPSGNRRWLPFLVESILNPREHPFDYENIYAEAYALYQQGFRHYFSDAEEEILKAHNKAFEVPQTAKEAIEKYFRAPAEGELGGLYTSTDILTHIGYNPALNLTPEKIGVAMQALKFVPHRSHGRRGYRLVAYKPEEIEANRHLLAYDARPEGEALPSGDDEGDGGVGIF
ncbi:MAG: hypothetical protein IJ059_02045 [Prevotella sp.]|nr:hypothetical protein [Prevotella sp.]